MKDINNLNETVHIKTVNSEPIVSVPNFDEHNDTTLNKKIIDNTEVFNTSEFIEVKKRPNIFLIMIIILFVIALFTVLFFIF